MELIGGRFTFHIFLCFRRDYSGPDPDPRQREDDVCDRVRLDRRVTVMADRQDVLRSKRKTILEIN